MNVQLSLPIGQSGNNSTVVHCAKPHGRNCA